MKKLRHCHPMYKCFQLSLKLSIANVVLMVWIKLVGIELSPKIRTDFVRLKSTFAPKMTTDFFVRLKMAFVAFILQEFTRFDD